MYYHRHDLTFVCTIIILLFIIIYYSISIGVIIIYIYIYNHRCRGPGAHLPAADLRGGLLVAVRGLAGILL